MTGTTSSSVTSADGTRIAYTATGSGPAVVVVDGALCYRGFGPAAGIARQLADGYRVFTYDRRGRGESEPGGGPAASGGPAGGGREREVADLAAVIAAAGGSAALVGLSSGAALALAAAGAGIGVTRVVAYEPPFSTDDGQRGRFKEYVAGMEQDLAAGRPGDAVARFMTFVGTPAGMLAQFRESPLWEVFEQVGPSLANDVEVLDGREGADVPTARLAELALPVLLVDGELASATMRAGVRAAAAAVPGAGYRTLAGQTHDVQPAVLAKAAAEFFAQG
ncbi:alpha/beta fold hydrolase [Kitasatospora sp. NPDC049285]|uniref:alpha/beta fold hydrolase n=1 Tax=Kitasatospora sp. NPDC049285 TaxID=3157096 RepID=UPI003418827D